MNIYKKGGDEIRQTIKSTPIEYIIKYPKIDLEDGELYTVCAQKT